MKVVVLWSRLSGYLSACLKELSETYGVELLVVTQPDRKEAPYARREFEWLENWMTYEDGSDYVSLRSAVLEFEPEGVFMSSWNFRDYMRLTRTPPLNALPRVAGMDNQWLGTLKQMVGIATSKVFLKPSIDRFFVPGERQAEFCRRLGYDRDQLISGFYTCDCARFERVYDRRKETESPRNFLFVGRLVEDKGIADLVDAYRSYRETEDDPYGLICAGTGPLADRLNATMGIELRGFVQPSELPSLFEEASCLILPSHFEPWGVVVHEATTAGLPVICTRSCGASVHLVQDEYNGFVIRPGQPVDLANAMMRYSRKSKEERARMGERSHMLSKQFSPTRWAGTLHGAFQRMGVVG